MGTGSFDVDFGTNFVAGAAAQILVLSYDPDVEGEDESPFALLPNVRCLSVDAREGPDPPTARFQYVLDNQLGALLGWPRAFEDVWPIDAQGPYVVRNDDRLVVAMQDIDGSTQFLFDGFAQVPQVDVSPSGEAVSFTAVNVAIRAFDEPITGSLRRDSSADGSIDDSGESDIWTDLPARFNPADHTIGSYGGFLPNATNENFDTVLEDEEDGGIPQPFPVFIDPFNPFGTITSVTPNNYWTVGGAVRYILANYNRDQEFVKHPDLRLLEQALVDYSPADGKQVMNPDDPSSFKAAPVTIRDYDASNKPWPRVLAELLAYAGFYMRFDTGTGPDGLPETAVKFYRRDEFAINPVKRVYLADGGSVVDFPSNVTGIRLARDASEIVNALRVETGPRQVEVSIAILPLYQPTAGDEVPGPTPATGRLKYSTSSWSPSTSATTRRKYRWYGADELGEGHLGFNDDGTTRWSTEPCKFEINSIKAAGGKGTPVFAPDEDGNPTFVLRYRPGHHTLISRDSQDRPLRATLQLAFPTDKDSAGPRFVDPTVIDTAELGAFKIIDIPSGNGWRLLPDRLGIEITVDDPEQWPTGDHGNPDTADGAVPNIQGISWWANPAPAGVDKADLDPTFGQIPVFILTVAIDDDQMMDAKAESRFVSPTKYTRWRNIDAKDHFQYATVNKSSRYYKQMNGDGKGPVVVRDDTDRANAHASQLRSKHEFPPIAGSLTLPYISTYYGVGDEISAIAGRDASLQSNIGAPQGESPTYPWCVGVSWSFENDRQSTQLILSDRRADAQNAW